MKKSAFFLTVTASTCILASSAFAAIEIQTSYVGDYGNANGNANDSTGYGSVNYGYRVGTYEVTNSQYVSFLNATGSTNAHGLYNSNMYSSVHGGIQKSGISGSFTYSVKGGMGEKAVNYVSFWDAARFTNWLTNGQGSGSTETGVYILTVDGITNNTITRNATAWDAGGVAVASENEWYKAAYYQPVGASGDTDSYWLYPNASNSIMTANANYANSGGTLTDVGTYSEDGSYYGTFDQGGNVWEWNDTIVSYANRGLRGGAFINNGDGLKASRRDSYNPAYEGYNGGFRASSLAPIPEPSTYAAIFGGLALAVATMRRSRS